MNLSCCLWALASDERDALSSLAEAGFQWIDVRPFQIEASPSELRDHGMKVSCVAVSHGMPDDATMNTDDPDRSAKASAYIDRALEFGRSLGATCAYVVPDGGDSIAGGYADSLADAAESASQLDMRLCVEHFPGTALPTVAATLRFLSQVGAENLKLLYDTGHAQMSGESADVIGTSSDELGYVHLDDNDGVEDLHLGLTDGVMTEWSLKATFDSLSKVGYDGQVSLELNPNLDDPMGALVRSRTLVKPLLT